MKLSENFKDWLALLGTIGLVAGFFILIGWGFAALVFAGFRLHERLFRLVHEAEPGILLAHPDAPILAPIAFSMAIVLGGSLALALWSGRSRARPPQGPGVPVAMARPAAMRKARLFLGCLALACAVFYLWSLRPHYRLHDDRLEIVSWVGGRSIPFAAVDDALITPGTYRRNRLFLHLRLTLDGGDVRTVRVSQSSLALLLTRFPRDMGCRTDRTPENRPGVQRQLEQIFATGEKATGLPPPPACVAILSE